MSGVIAAGDPQTAAAGATILQRGGNAVDAAVAAAFASFIAEVGVVHMGGSGLAQIVDPVHNRAVVYDFFSNAPGLELAGSVVKDFEKVTIDFGSTTQDFYLGRASVAVPGNVFGLCQLAADHGRLPLAELLQPALALARSGIPLAPFQADTCALLAPLYTHTEAMRQIFMPNGHIIRAGERLFIPNLAGTLEALAQEGEALLRNGSLAHSLVADQAANGGLLTEADLNAFSVHILPSIRLPYRGHEILLPPPSSSGGVLTAFTLKLLERFDLSRLAHGSAAHLQLLFESMAATSRARPYWERLSQVAPGGEAVAQFLDEAFVQPFYEDIRRRIHSRRPPEPHAEPPGPSNTSHLSVVDDAGLTVSLTTTAGESAGYVVPGTGFIPNNIMGEEDLHPHGFHTHPPGQRIATMMTPAVILEQGQPRLVLGSGGSIRIRSAILQVLSNLLDFHMPLVTAVQQARVHVEGGALQCEAGYDPRSVDQLERWGYAVNRWDKRSIYFGGAHSVARSADGQLTAAGDDRRGGATAFAGA